MMSKERFLLLLRVLQYDDIDTCDKRKKTDILALMSGCWGEYVIIDEMLEAFWDSCKFQQYISHKPAKYRVKIYALMGATIFYMQNLKTYYSKQAEGWSVFQMDSKYWIKYNNG